LDATVPHPTTLMKLTTRCGTAAVDGCNEALLAKAAQARLLRTTWLRADTTVVPADVAYPTDWGLLAKAVRRIAVTGRRIQAAGGATRSRLRDRSRSAGKRAHGIATKLRLRSAQGRDEAQRTVQRITGEVAGLAVHAGADAQRLLGNARRALRMAQAKAEQRAARGVRDAAAGRRRGRLRRAVNDLAELLDVTRRIAAQTRQRLAGTTPAGATRRVSLHEPDARPNRRRLARVHLRGGHGRIDGAGADGAVLGLLHRHLPDPAARRTAGSASTVLETLPISMGSGHDSSIDLRGGP